MSKIIQARLLLARMGDDVEPCIVAAIDHTVWENWDDDEEAAWIKAGKKTWGIDYDTEFKVVDATFPAWQIVAAFDTPVVDGQVSHSRPEGDA